MNSLHRVCCIRAPLQPATLISAPRRSSQQDPQSRPLVLTAADPCSSPPGPVPTLNAPGLRLMQRASTTRPYLWTCAHTRRCCSPCRFIVCACVQAPHAHMHTRASTFPAITPSPTPVKTSLSGSSSTTSMAGCQHWCGKSQVGMLRGNVGGALYYTVLSARQRAA
jgi:hypothetical protein